MNNLTKSLFVTATLSFSAPLWAADKLPILSGNDGCISSDYVYKAGDIIKAPKFQRDPKTHKLVAVEWPDAPRQKCEQDATDKKYAWKNVDQLADGKLVPAAGYDTFTPSAPIGMVKKMSAKEIKKAHKAHEICKGVDGPASIGAVIQNLKGDKLLRCTQIQDDNSKVVDTGWVEIQGMCVTGSKFTTKNDSNASGEANGIGRLTSSEYTCAACASLPEAGIYVPKCPIQVK